MEKKEKAALVCCSNGRPKSEEGKIKELGAALEKIGIAPVFSGFLYRDDSDFTGKERAGELMGYYRDDSVKAIFDISGGDLANEVLPFLDYGVIGASGKSFFGYSDLTAVLNAIYAKTGKESILYQVRNLIGEDGVRKIGEFQNFLCQSSDELLRFRYRFVQKKSMQGILVGGNIRCLLKLAGTEYWPDMEGKILFLEAMSGKTPQLITYFSQLRQLGALDRAAGILLGTFLSMEEEEGEEALIKLVKYYAGKELPIAKSPDIGHKEDSKAVVVGRFLKL